jgi:amino acid transporter
MWLYVYLPSIISLALVFAPAITKRYLKSRVDDLLHYDDALEGHGEILEAFAGGWEATTTYFSTLLLTFVSTIATLVEVARASAFGFHILMVVVIVLAILLIASAFWLLAGRPDEVLNSVMIFGRRMPFSHSAVMAGILFVSNVALILLLYYASSHPAPPPGALAGGP